MHIHHKRTSARDKRRLLFALLLTGSFMVVEAIGGILSGSLALLADAGHMLTDTVALTFAWMAFRFSEKPADTKRTYGYERLQILAALFNGVSLIGIVIWIVYEAVNRLLEPQPILGGMMLLVAGAGLLVNLVAFKVLHSGDKDNLNMRGAMLHVLGDLLGSVAAIVAAIVILATGWTPIDPILSVFVAALILFSAWKLVRNSIHILLEGAPDWLDVAEMESAVIEQVDGVIGIHHVHVWSLNAENTLLTMHAEVQPDADQARILHQVKSFLWRHFNIGHSTIELDIAGQGHEYSGDNTNGTPPVKSSI